MKDKVMKFGSYAVMSLTLFLFEYGVTFAATFASLVGKVTGGLASSLIRLIFALAFVYFFWGVVQYVLYPDDEGKKDKGRDMMLWGIIGLVVMFSVYGLIRVVSNTLFK